MAQPSRRSLFQTVHDYFMPHARNRFRPHIFSRTSLVVLLVVALAFEGAYLAQVKYVFLKTNFLASVLPETLTTLTNADRASNHLSMVTSDPVLTEAAQASADDMASKGYFSHVTPDGKQPWYWLDAAGYQFSYAGQNLAVNFTDSTDVETAWMNSPTHRANIVKPEYTRVGIGVAHGMYKGKEATFVVQFFATPAEVATAHASGKSEKAVPLKVVAVATTTSSSAHGTEVLGTATSSPTTHPLRAAQALALSSAVNPTHTMAVILSAAALLLLMLIGIALSVKARARYVEVLGSGLLLLLTLLGLLFYNSSRVIRVTLPDARQAAAVIRAL